MQVHIPGQWNTKSVERTKGRPQDNSPECVIAHMQIEQERLLQQLQRQRGVQA
ncbi:hypothetical protein Dxin01_00091 [Deinococcus xinjiangensis]|uniref:Uncharacterized protein n=1 Tax=Deinococcus xinjiangensis TaxID=457454 RepID=A0ABP9V508_9DEIO